MLGKYLRSPSLHLLMFMCVIICVAQRPVPDCMTMQWWEPYRKKTSTHIEIIQMVVLLLLPVVCYRLSSQVIIKKDDDDDDEKTHTYVHNHFSCKCNKSAFVCVYESVRPELTLYVYTYSIIIFYIGVCAAFSCLSIRKWRCLHNVNKQQMKEIIQKNTHIHIHKFTLSSPSVFAFSFVDTKPPLAAPMKKKTHETHSPRARAHNRIYPANECVR